MRTAAVLLALVAMIAVASAQSTGAPAQPATICDRLTVAQGLNFQSAADEYTAVKTFILRLAAGTATLSGLFTDVNTKEYFNGNINYRNTAYVVSPSPFASQTPTFTPDFTVAGTYQDTLVQHLSQFFGASGALNCAAWGTDPQYQYSNSAVGFGTFNQYQVHANMNITGGLFTNFNNKVIATAASFDLSSADQTAIQGVLAAFGRNNAAGGQANQVCWETSCPCSSAVTGANCDNAGSAASVQVSIVSLIVAAFVAVFAMRR